LLHNPSSVRKLTAEPQPSSSLMPVHMIGQGVHLT
jgi:hypothetical protein